MCCRITDLKNKEVINLKTGSKMGCVCDVIVDTCTGKIIAIVVPGECRFFGFFRDDDYEIPWDCIEKIGDDLILVCYEIPFRSKAKKQKFFL